MEAVSRIPHRLTCSVLSLFGGSKCDADMESGLHVCLDALALQVQQQPASGKAAGQRLKRMSHEVAPTRLCGILAWEVSG